MDAAHGKDAWTSDARIMHAAESEMPPPLTTGAAHHLFSVAKPATVRSQRVRHASTSLLLTAAQNRELQEEHERRRRASAEIQYHTEMRTEPHPDARAQEQEPAQEQTDGRWPECTGPPVAGSEDAEGEPPQEFSEGMTNELWEMPPAGEDVQPPPLEPESSFEETAAVIPQEPSPYSQSRAVDARRARRQARMAASIPATPLPAEATDAQGGVHPPTYWAEDQQA